MTTYADPSRCPDCRATLPEAPQVCPRCALPLTGTGAVELFTTLQRADLLLAGLRQQAAVAPLPAPATVGCSARGRFAAGGRHAVPGPEPARRRCDTA